MRTIAFVFAAMFLALGVVSCRDRTDEQYRAEMVKAEQMAISGNATGALHILVGMVDMDAFKSHKVEMLSRMVGFAWMAGDADQARKYFQSGLEAAPAGMEGLLGLMIENLAAKQSGEEFVEWCRSMDKVAFGEPAREMLTLAQVRALCGLGRSQEVLPLTGAVMGQSGAPAAINLARRVFSVLLEAGCKEQAAEVPALVEKILPGSPEKKGVLCDMRLVLMTREGRLDEALAFFRQEIAGIPDENVLNGMNILANCLPDKGDSLSEELMTTCLSRNAVREAAARHWMRSVRERKDVAGMGVRLVSLRERGLSAGFIADQMDGVYTEFLGSGDAKAMAPVYAMFDSLMKNSQDLNFKRRVAGYLLDMGFFLEKYAESLALVESDLFKDDERVMTGVLAAKIKAHLALQEKRTDDAVRHFREFMLLISKQMVDREMDPLDGSWVTADMVMGLNCRRIGDILAEAGRAEEAAKAYAEARGYYEKALLVFPDKESKENRKIQAGLDALPKG